MDMRTLNGRVSRVGIENPYVRHGLDAMWHSGSVSCSESIHEKMTQRVNVTKRTFGMTQRSSERYMDGFNVVTQ
jgi:hypothetical protein